MDEDINQEAPDSFTTNNVKIKHISTFVDEQCACFGKNGACLGIDVFNKRFRPEGKCWILEDKPCQYFEKALLPLAQRHYPEIYESIMKQYVKIQKHIDQDELEEVRTCATSGCGVPVFKNNLYCKGCKKKMKRKSRREYYHRTKGNNNEEP